MSIPDDGMSLADSDVAAIGDWLAAADLSGLPEPTPPVELPPADTLITVVRPVRIPYEVDALIKALAEARGVSMSTLIRDWIAAGLATTGQAPDPLTELRRGLDTAQRALDTLALRTLTEWRDTL
jgi:hypothetical protein